MTKRQRYWVFTILFAFLILSAGCNATSPELPVEDTEAPQVSTPKPTASPVTPSATPVELAAQVNGDQITLAAYQAELSRYQAAVGTELATEDKEKVIGVMIDELLLAQAAAQTGFVVDSAMLQNRIEQLDLTGQELQTWIESQGYTDESFRIALSRSIAAAWMRDQIVAEVPDTTEQVHARQILLYNSEEANNVFNQLEAGADFKTLAAQYDPRTTGDLGWFPRGYLTVPELDEVIFGLEPGEYSPVVQTMLGFHIVQVIEREAERPLSPGAYQVVQAEALQKWLLDRRDQSEIIAYVP